MFFTWTGNLDTDHVAMVEYCTRDDEGNVTVHCLEGNTPAAVKRASYDLSYSRILGFGTVHDAADWTIRGGNSGEKVRQLQEKLIALGYLPADGADGVYGGGTAAVIREIQAEEGLKQTGIANISTQAAIDRRLREQWESDPSIWLVEEVPEDGDLSLDSFWDLDALQAAPQPADPDEEDYTLSAGDPDEEAFADELEEIIEDDLPDWVEEERP